MVRRLQQKGTLFIDLLFWPAEPDIWQKDRGVVKKCYSPSLPEWTLLLSCSGD